MKWQSETYTDYVIRKKAELMEWHNWFAWHPVLVESEDIKVWLETVERRLLYTYGWDMQHYVWEYRSKNDNTN